MTEFSDEDIALIDQRIRVAQQKMRAVGVCVSRDTTGPGAQVLFDGSTVAMRVKVLGNVSIQPGIRCVLDKYDTSWFVTGAWSAFQLGLSHYRDIGTGTDTTTSTTYVDSTQIGPQPFTKYYDNTQVQILGLIGAWVSGSASQLRFGIRFTPLSGQNYTATDYNLTLLDYNVVNQHLSNAGGDRLTDLPAGDYSWQLRWRRVSGTGTMTTDTHDSFTIFVDEILKQGSPIL